LEVGSPVAAAAMAAQSPTMRGRPEARAAAAQNGGRAGDGVKALAEPTWTRPEAARAWSAGGPS